MIDISHIVTNGCSYTYGDELADPRNECWPAHVAKNLGVPVINLARGSIGNDAIHRRTYEYFYEDSENNNNPLYIIGFSHFTRKESWNEQFKCYKGIHLNNRKIENMDITQRQFLENHNLEELYRRTLRYKISLKNLFSAHNIPHLFVDMMNSLEDGAECIKKFPKLMKKLDNDFNNMGIIYPKLVNPTHCPQGHFDAKTNEQIGNLITDEIRARYNLNIVHDKKFLSLIDYTKNIEPYYLESHMINYHGAWY